MCPVCETQPASPRFLFKLDSPLTLAQTMTLSRSCHPPHNIVTGVANPALRYLEVSLETKDDIKRFLKTRGGGAVFLQLPSSAAKNLEEEGKTLGGVDMDGPEQEQYPVPYFFYGTPADPDRLLDMLDISSSVVLASAKIRSGKVKMWGQYRALVDASEEDEVDGHIFVVESKEQEDVLRRYEGGRYEVVRCGIKIDGEEKAVEGLTFRFCGEESELREV